ncbi:MAG: antitoxin VbhA family protein [Nitrospirota bacterium]|jgi:hypothetical protein|nr:antitoxin VbhA family protein [Nitrospira sp.]HRB17068.1 antitoxin VbhA family protein [Nitrospira sp.]
MNVEDTRREAFRQADAILALEGMEKPPEMDGLQEAVIDGRMSFGVAVSVTILEEQTRSRRRQ